MTLASFSIVSLNPVLNQSPAERSETKQKMSDWCHLGFSDTNFPRRCVSKSIVLDKNASLSKVWFGLVCWVLWHINLCRLFYAKSIFM